MTERILSVLRDFGDALLSGFLWPGYFLHDRFVTIAPQTAAGMGLDAEPAISPIMSSLVFWLVAVLLIYYFFRLGQRAYRFAGSIARTIAYRVIDTIGNVKTMIVCRFRNLLPHHKTIDIHSDDSVDFDDLDLAVLRAAAAIGAKSPLSTKDLARKFTLKPAQVARSIDKLSRNKMIDAVDGVRGRRANYRVTPAGNSFLMMWQRQAQRQAVPQ